MDPLEEIINHSLTVAPKELQDKNWPRESCGRSSKSVLWRFASRALRNARVFSAS